MAEALESKSPLPMGQMVGNRFVPTPWTMGLASAIGDFASYWQGAKADEEEKKLSTDRVDRSRKVLSDQLDALRTPTDENDPRFAPYDINAPDPKSPFQAGRDFTLEGPKLDFNAALREQQNVVPKVNVLGQAGGAPEFTDPIKAKRLQMMIEALDSGMAPEQIAQLNLQQQLGDIAPVKLGLGETYGIPGQAPMATNPKPIEPRPAQFVESGAGTDAQGRPMTVKKLFDPAKGAVDIPGLQPTIGGPLVSNTNTVATAGPKAFNEEIGKLDAKRLGELREGASSAQATIETLGRMRDSIKQGTFAGGGADAKVFVTNMIAGLTGSTPKELPGSQLFNAQAGQLILDRIKLLGANPSNADLAFIRETVPKLATSVEARDALIGFMEQKARSQIDLYLEADTYARQNSGFGGFGMRGLTPGGGAVGTPSGGAKASHTIKRIQ